MQPFPGEAPRGDDYGFALPLVSALTLFAVAVNGYHPYAEDGGLYLAGVKRLLDPQLYPHSAEFVLAPTRHSLFAPMVAALARIATLGGLSGISPARALPVFLLALHLASIWLTLFAGWLLATRCWSARPARAGAVVLLACWLGLPVAGTALLFMDPYVTARSLSTPCMVLALAGALDLSEPGSEVSTESGEATGSARRRRGLGLWIGSIAAGAAVHPLMAVYAVAGSLLLLCLRSARRSVRLQGTAALCLAGFALAWGIHRAAPAESPE